MLCNSLLIYMNNNIIIYFLFTVQMFLFGTYLVQLQFRM